MAYMIHNYTFHTEEDLPQDPGLDGEGWTFETLEHSMPFGSEGGSFPLSIRATDPEGRTHTYQSMDRGGKPIKSHGFTFNTHPEARAYGDFPPSKDAPPSEDADDAKQVTEEAG